MPRFVRGSGSRVRRALSCRGARPSRWPCLRLVFLLCAAGAAARPAGAESNTPRQDPAPVLEDGQAAGQTVDPAHEEALNAETARIGATLRCPVCRQQSVAESSSRIARDMQALIRGMLAEGKTAEEIEAYFVAAYGDWILLRPKAQGVNALVYILPAAAFLIGLLWVGVKLTSGGRAPSRAVATATAGAPGLDSEDRAWLDEAIRESD